MLTKLLCCTSIFFFFSTSASPSILDVVVIGKDTLIASTHDFKVVVSYNGGKTWKTTKRELIKQLGVEDKRVWGIDSWMGIHESDYSRLYYSDDFGKNWKQIELNPKKFFAMTFLQINSKLLIVDAFGGLWEHRKTAIETDKSWIKLTTKQAPYRGEALHTFTANKYAFLFRDSLYIHDFKLGKTTGRKGFSESISAFCFKNNDSLVAIDNNGNVYGYSLANSEYRKVREIKDYRYFLDILSLDNRFYIMGMGNNAINDFALFSTMGKNYEHQFIKGLTGVDQDICFVDKYKRIWCGTTDGLFVLSGNEKSFRKIL